VDIISRWLHIAAAAVAVGGLVYARFVVFPSLQLLSEDTRAMLSAQFSARLKPIALSAVAALFLSGVYNLYRVLERGIVDSTYHAVFGLKFLLALHLFAMLFLLSAPPSGDAARDARRPRLMLGAVISGLLILALGAYLRTLHS
jgi:uncharacterized membrane protein